MAQTWVIVANANRARFFERGEDGGLQEFDVMESRCSTPARATTVFVNKLAEYIDDARIAGYLDTLVLIAASNFLDQLQASLGKNAREMVVQSIDKELTTASTELVAEEIGTACWPVKKSLK